MRYFASIAAGVAQLVEHLICNQRVGGSSPFAGSMSHLKIAGVVEWLMAPGCKPGGFTPYGGSNPPPCTRSRIVDFRLNAYWFFKSAIENRQSAIIWAGVAQLVEHQPSKLRVASSSLVARSSFR